MTQKEIAEKARYRREAALRMRRDGMTYREISEMMGVTPVRVRQLCIMAVRDD